MYPNNQLQMVVLIVEDETLLRMHAVEIVEAAGFGTIEAKHASEAISILESTDDIHLIFTDINMPGSMDGLQLTHFVRHRWPPIRIMATSGHEKLTDEDLPPGGRFLRKPYTESELGELLRQMVASAP